MTDDAAAAVELLRRLIACDTSNPPGRETQAAAILEDFYAGTNIECTRVAKDPARANLLCRLAGSGAGPSLAFLGHLDVVPARREEWAVEPFAGVLRDRDVWGRGAVDMKSQVAAVAAALAMLDREGFRPAGDLMLILMADEEVGDAEVGAPYFVEQMADLRIDYVVGEGAGERIPTAQGPLYLLDVGAKATATVTLRVRGRAGDASLPTIAPNALDEAARLLSRLAAYRPPLRLIPEIEPLLSFLAPDGTPEERTEQARRAHPALEELIPALTRTVIHATLAESNGPANVIPPDASITLKCILVPGTTRADLDAELREALGDGDYELDFEGPDGGSLSTRDSPLRDAIEQFLAEHDPQARLIPALGYGFTDCHLVRTTYGATVYGFIPFRHADPMVNLTTKHANNERVSVADVAFQVAAARHIAQAIGRQDTSRPFEAN
jgi:acetylornithine deacetylase/succinyl-diaminopimelate desuccinylase-like protein